MSEENTMFDQTMYKKMTTFQKTASDNTFAAMDKIHEQSESMMNVFFNQASWLPQESRTMFKDWSQNFKTVREQYKTMVEEGFKSYEGWVDSFNQSPPKEPVKAAKA